MLDPKFFWLNRFNGVESEGPFASVTEAKESAVSTYVCLQDGFAFDIAITTDTPVGPVVVAGHIKGGVWFDGDFSETDAEQAERLAAA